MHHHVFGLGTLALVGGLIAAPQLIETARGVLGSPVAGTPVAGPNGSPAEASRAMLASAIDATLEAGRSGRFDASLDAFASHLQRRAGVPERDVDAVLDAARGPEGRRFLETLAATVRHPENVSVPAGLGAGDRRAIADLARSLRGR